MAKQIERRDFSSLDIHDKRAALTERLDRMEEIATGVAAEGRTFRPGEDAEYRQLSSECDRLEAAIKQDERQREGHGSSGRERPHDAYAHVFPEHPKGRALTDTRTGGFGDAIMRSGWNLWEQRHVAGIPLSELRTLPDVVDWSPRVIDGVQALGRDERWLWPFLPSQDIGTDTSVQDFRQTGERTVSGTIQRDLDATTDKATLAVAIEHVVAEVKQLAVVIEDIPSALLESLQGARAFYDSEARFQLNAALDAHVMAMIDAANPSTSWTGDNLVERVRHGIAAMRAVGSVPRLLVVNPTDAAALDLFQHGESESTYMFPTREAGVGSPLWGLRLIERTSDDDPPMLIDPQRLGLLYTGMLGVLADPYSKMKKNLVDLRFEMSTLMHVRTADAVLKIEEPGDGDGDG
jgi:hypothetical protein